MSPLLGPCPSCARHVRVSEERCPFCEASLEGHTYELVPEASERLPRVALVVFATTLAVGVTASVPAGAQRVGPGSHTPTLGVSAYGGPGLSLDPGATTAAYGAPSPRESVLRGSATFTDVRVDDEGRDASECLRVLRRYVGAVRATYERALRLNTSLRGQMEVTLTLAPDGRVTNVRVRPGVFPAEMVEGLQRAWMRARFPRGNGRAEVRFRVAFVAVQ